MKTTVERAFLVCFSFLTLFLIGVAGVAHAGPTSVIVVNKTGATIIAQVIGSRTHAIPPGPWAIPRGGEAIVQMYDKPGSPPQVQYNIPVTVKFGGQERQVTLQVRVTAGFMSAYSNEYGTKNSTWYSDSQWHSETVVKGIALNYTLVPGEIRYEFVELALDCAEKSVKDRFLKHPELSNLGKPLSTEPDLLLNREKVPACRWAFERGSFYYYPKNVSSLPPVLNAIGKVVLVRGAMLEGYQRGGLEKGAGSFYLGWPIANEQQCTHPGPGICQEFEKGYVFLDAKSRILGLPPKDGFCRVPGDKNRSGGACQMGFDLGRALQDFGEWVPKAVETLQTSCAFQTKPLGRNCKALTERCTPGCPPTTCAERVQGLTHPNSPTQLTPFFQGAVSHCKAPRTRTETFQCAWREVVTTYPDLGSDTCTKDRLLQVFNTVAFNYSLLEMTEAQACDLPRDGRVPPSYFAIQASPRLLDTTGQKPKPHRNPKMPDIGYHEGRLVPKLRAVARVASPLDCSLRLAAIKFATAKNDTEREEARAYADLSVTGRKAFAEFRQKLPTESYCKTLRTRPITQCPESGTLPGDAQLQAGCLEALRRTYQVANFLRTGQALPKSEKEARRKDLKWIAVSGEDDSPHRPVNVPSSSFPQYDIEVQVEAPLAKAPYPQKVTVRSRYFIAHFRPPPKSTRLADDLSLAPDPVPAIAPDAEILLFIHGMDSRAEEAEDITKELFKLLEKNKSKRNLTIISIDLPTSGYAENLDFERVSPLREIGTPKFTPLPFPLPVSFIAEPLLATVGFAGGVIPPGTTTPFVIPPGVPIPDYGATGKTPLLDFIENFIVRFVETLDRKLPIKSKIKAVMGGSLGGNMTFRLGRRCRSERPGPCAPGEVTNMGWLPSFIVWSPASIWDSLAGGPDIFKHIGVRVPWENANRSRPPSDSSHKDAEDPGHLRVENANLRRDFFEGWDKETLPVIIPMAQSDTWQSDFYPCKKSAIIGARLDRQETYDPRFLAWHWRLAAEQLIYSHQTIDEFTKQPRYLSNAKRMLLACGTEDNVPFNNICDATRKTAPLMMTTPGKAVFLTRTGHSVDNERREYFAKEILEFLGP